MLLSVVITTLKKLSCLVGEKYCVETRFAIQFTGFSASIAENPAFQANSQARRTVEKDGPHESERGLKNTCEGDTSPGLMREDISVEFLSFPTPQELLLFNYPVLLQNARFPSHLHFNITFLNILSVHRSLLCGLSYSQRTIHDCLALLQAEGVDKSDTDKPTGQD